MAGPLRFRRSNGSWNEQRVRERLLRPLDEAFGARLERPWFDPPRGYEARRLEMDNGDFALFCWDGGRAYWMGNTTTPEALWRTEKYDFTEVPYPVARWAQRELLARLELVDPWLAEYDHVAWFFLPVFLSKDGRDTTRAFFDEHAGGFPDATRDEALAFFERALASGELDEYRYTMASKLGTSRGMDVGRMAATMGEFVVAKLLVDAGLDFEPEIQLDSGHALDFRVAGGHLVEVTRPRPPARRSRADTPVAAVRETADAKTNDQLKKHPSATLFVDCSSFRDDEWATLRAERPSVAHRPTVVFRARPDGRVEGYRVGTLPFDTGDAIEWLD
ncbi:DUF5784 family protein [Halosegnis marinus]|uniref:DUF5784 family protein n=1 Tax=Halosegnis marinus TaxID=3034023 RepID=A0ABD5ZNI4_9EURY|nr:DUF5784 family protein [Halosegnis sp. DT85]